MFHTLCMLNSQHVGVLWCTPWVWCRISWRSMLSAITVPVWVHLYIYTWVCLDCIQMDLLRSCLWLWGLTWLTWRQVRCAILFRCFHMSASTFRLCDCTPLPPPAPLMAYNRIITTAGFLKAGHSAVGLWDRGAHSWLMQVCTTCMMEHGITQWYLFHLCLVQVISSGC